MDLPFRLNVNKDGLPTLAAAKKRAENADGNIVS